MTNSKNVMTNDKRRMIGFSKHSGFELGTQLRKHAEAVGTEFIQTEVQSIEKKEDYFTLTTAKGTFESRAIIAASGARHRELGVSGEKELTGMGVSYCATCDGAFFRNRIVAVVGGGNVALEDALFLARGCSKVYLIHRRDELRGEKILQEQVKETENIEILYSHQVSAIEGSGQVTSVKLYDKKADSTTYLTVDGVFIAVGIDPNTEIYRGLAEMDESGFICAGEDGVTSMPGLFAAGDLRTKQLRQVITAAADGANCVTSVERYLVTLHAKQD